MEKPIIFFHFDYEKYREKQYQEGYFDYKDSFGKVISDYNKVIESILGYLKNDYKMEKHFKENTKYYFQFRDKNNCERIYNEIIKL